jgi:ferric-dicitrate binding protein FerR (iron transport regulator)
MNTELESDIRNDEALEALFAKAAARPLPRAESEERVRQQVHVAWQQALRQRSRRRRTFMAMAASVAVLAIVGMLLNQADLPVSGRPVAMVDKRFGELHVVDASGVPYYASSGHFALTPGQTVSTRGGAGLAMTWSNGGSLRMDEYTSMTLTSANEIYLQRGRLYFDSSAGSSDSFADDTGVLVIRTDRGVVTPLGTRYVTQLTNDKLTVLVRDGSVSVESAEFSATAGKGERLLVAGNEMPSVVPVASFGDEWSWIEKTTPIWNTEGRSIAEFLAWVGQESGRSIHYDSVKAERLAGESISGFGQIDLEPSLALQLVLLSTDLDWSLDGGAVVVSEKRTDNGAT